MSFEIATVIVVLGIFVLLGIGANRADKALSQMANDKSVNNQKTN
ncbi:MAG TPA: hypothetical protein PLZ08_06655 [Bacillota bacterium]|jgi:hypothetical protein|nr:hypothetical protein [Bacillota bacterium]HOL09629.1 hypothetical protein [Bacillota bacterium]HPO97624.1 hypothetical protein [Bacillota bacterium]